MVPIYVCEDEIEIRAKITKIIENYLFIQNYDMSLVFSGSSPETLLDITQTTNQMGIYFLDIDLQHELYDGFSLAKAIRKYDTRGFIIFITTHEELAFETFKQQVEAQDFILKDKIDSLQERITQNLNHIQQLISLERNLPTRYYTLKIADTLHHLPIDQIILFETEKGSHMISLYTNTEVFKFRGNLKDIQKEFGTRFFHSHRSCLLNIMQIKSINLKKMMITMNNDHSYPLSRHMKAKLPGILH